MPKKKRAYKDQAGYYFSVHVKRWKKHIEGDWDNGPLIYKVPLSPEQAVMSCCSSTPDGAIGRITIEGGVCNFAGACAIPLGCEVSAAIKITFMGVGCGGGAPRGYSKDATGASS